ncbi:hypothetical protein GCM10023144_03500 [Pigmentiphaga soli]|uniref:Prepilin-type N-terminal cleavage/methylation domain-containing protein n=1 Tax=Pigmentiphaga soli TaxID=1007095 RepID=A0ABP8GES7_9BURK
MRDHRHRGAFRQRGFALVEVAIAAAIATVIAVFGAARLVQQVNDAAAQATGTYLLAVKGALDTYLVAHYDDLANGRAVPGVQMPDAPRLAELRAGGLLNPGFPDRTPFGQQVAVRLLRSGACPGSGCRIDALAYTLAPLRLAGADEPPFDLVAQAVASAGGFGGAAYPDAPRRLRGATFAVDNPAGAAAGVVGALATLDTTLFNEFVRMRDRRDPDLQGDLSVRGRVAAGELAVGAAGGAPCATLQASGVLALGCAGLLDAHAARFAAGADAVQIDPAAGVATSQRVRAAAGFSTGTASLFDAAEAQPTIRVGAGQMALATGAGTALTLDGQGVVAHAGLSAGRLGLRETAVRNAPCASGTGQSDFARSADGGLLVCAAGNWRAVADVAVPAAACSPNGAFATDRDSGAGLFCRLGVWVRADDLLSSYVLVATALAGHGDLVPKPACGQLGAAAGAPAIYLIPQIESSTGAAFTRRARDDGAAWRVELLDHDAQPLAGPAQALAQVYCKY